MTRLGDGLAESGELGDEPIARTVAAVADMAAEAKRDGVTDLAAVGTAGLRAAPNRNAFIAAVERDAGVHVEVISGEEEARLAYLAATSALQLDVFNLFVVDSGCGSSQFMFCEGHEVTALFIVDVGAIRFTERFGLDKVVSKAVLDEALAAIGAELERLDGRPTPDAVIGMGGTVTNLAAVKHELAEYDPDVVQGTVLDRADRSSDRALSKARRRRAAQDCRPAAEARGDHPRRGVHRADRAREAGRRLADGERPRAARHGLLAERWG